jgi:hypothetical protein
MSAARMTFIPRFLLLLLLAMISNTAISQSLSDNHDPVYGYDPLLYNGRMYYFYQPGTGGTQYLHENFDPQGTITFRGVTFSNLSINYDVYNQLLVLKYKDAIGSNKLIEVSYAWLESFTLGGYSFEYISESNSTRRIYQVLGSGNKKILYFYRKDMLLHNQTISGLYYFSKTIKEKYVFNDNHIVKFNTNKSFLAAFSPAQQVLIKKYIRKQNINVKKANDAILTDLINYCKTLAGS